MTQTIIAISRNYIGETTAQATLYACVQQKKKKVTQNNLVSPLLYAHTYETHTSLKINRVVPATRRLCVNLQTIKLATATAKHNVTSSERVWLRTNNDEVWVRQGVRRQILKHIHALCSIWEAYVTLIWLAHVVPAAYCSHQVWCLCFVRSRTCESGTGGRQCCHTKALITRN